MGDFLTIQHVNVSCADRKRLVSNKGTEGTMFPDNGVLRRIVESVLLS